MNFTRRTSSGWAFSIGCTHLTCVRVRLSSSDQSCFLSHRDVHPNVKAETAQRCGACVLLHGYSGHQYPALLLLHPNNLPLPRNLSDGVIDAPHNPGALLDVQRAGELYHDYHISRWKRQWDRDPCVLPALLRQSGRSLPSERPTLLQTVQEDHPQKGPPLFFHRKLHRQQKHALLPDVLHLHVMRVFVLSGSGCCVFNGGVLHLLWEPPDLPDSPSTLGLLFFYRWVLKKKTFWMIWATLLDLNSAPFLLQEASQACSCSWCWCCTCGWASAWCALVSAPSRCCWWLGDRRGVRCREASWWGTAATGGPTWSTSLARAGSSDSSCPCKRRRALKTQTHKNKTEGSC